MAQVRIDPVGNVVELVERFTRVALDPLLSSGDPLPAILVTVGGLLTAASLGVFGVLSVGAGAAYARRLLGDG